MTADPVEFLTAALARAEETAKAASRYGEEWTEGGDGVYLKDTNCSVAIGPYGCGLDDGVGGHIALHDPASVLRRVAVERQILAEHQPTWSDGEPEFDYHHEAVISKETGRTRYIDVRNDKPVAPYWCRSCQAQAPCRTVLLLAQAWGWTEETT